MYGSHDMRHTGFRMLIVVNGTPGFLGITKTSIFQVLKDLDPSFHLLVIIEYVFNILNI